MAEAGTLFEEQQWFLQTVNLGGGNWKCQTSDLMLLSKYKREPEAWYKHVVLYCESEATSSYTAYLFRLIPWLLELDSRTWQPIRLPGPWDSPGKNTGVGCHFLFQLFPKMCQSEWKSLCRVWLFATPWTMQSMEFSRPEYWNG